MKQAAVAYAERGHRVFPVSKRKHPLLPRAPDGKQRPVLSASDLLARTAIETDRLHCLDLPYPEGVISSGAELLTLARTIAQATKAGIDGIVVTHGNRYPRRGGVRYR